MKKSLTSFSRALRSNMTDAERCLWHRLRQRRMAGHKFRRQYPIGAYIVDFACPEGGLVVELDGGQHLEQAAADAVRDAWLESQGFRVLRFWNDQVLRETDAVLEQILMVLGEKDGAGAGGGESPPPPRPSPTRGEGEQRGGQDEDSTWMRYALELARRAAQQGEVPVGAVLVKDGVVVGEGWNRPITTHDPSAHAEMVALRDAAQRAGNYRLTGTTLYVTLEPCVMCAGAIVHARVERLVFGARDPKAGAVDSVYDVIARPRLNHAVSWEGGVMDEECGGVLREFFRARR